MKYERARSLLTILLPVLLAGAAGCGSSAGQQTGGTGGATGGSPGNLDSGADGAADSFVLSWQDDFDTLDATAWQLQTSTFGGNEAQFTAQNAAVTNGILTI